MATISKFYLHDVISSNTGTMPGAGDAFIVQGDNEGQASGARTSRTANDTIGAAQTSVQITALANTSLQRWGYRRYVSSPLAAQTFATADGNWTFSWASLESNTNHNGAGACHIYLWRPSTGLRIGTVFAVPSASITSTTQQALSATDTMSGTQAILDGDILVFEVSDVFTQSMSTAYTSTFFYDGTTEASTTNCASFVTPPAALTLSQAIPPAAIHPHLPFMS